MNTFNETSQKSNPHISTGKTVAVVGGGLAGLAASCALCDAGFEVTLFEKRPYLGGRASSYEHPGTGEVVDNCQHVLLGCCTNLLDFYTRIGVEQKVRWFDRLTFIEPGGKCGTLEASFLPAPLHASPAFLGFPLLSLRDKLGIARAMLSVVDGVPLDNGKDFLNWLRNHGQTQRAIDRFWSPVLVSALNEELDNVSVYYGAMVFRDAFLKSAQAGRMGIPTVPLSELYGVAADYIRNRGGEVRLRANVEEIGQEGHSACVGIAGEKENFDFVISAVPFNSVGRILPPGTANELQKEAEQLESSPITGIHLWFDREITSLEHAVLLERTIQWMFQKSKLLAGRASSQETQGTGSYLELVVSSSKSLVEKSRGEIVELALKELGEFFPKVREAKLLKSTVIKEVHATFSPSPGSDSNRPGPETQWPNIFVSGDWTATGWPATMEGAVRGGYLTAEALARAAGSPHKFLVADLPAQGMMRIFR